MIKKSNSGAKNGTEPSLAIATLHSADRCRQLGQAEKRKLVNLIN
jgi:hypothetical protein